VIHEFDLWSDKQDPTVPSCTCFSYHDIPVETVE